MRKAATLPAAPFMLRADTLRRPVIDDVGRYPPMDQPEDTPTLPARFYRQKAADARRTAEGVTTQALKERLHRLARDFDRLADAADSAVQPSDPLAELIRQQWRGRG